MADSVVISNIKENILEFDAEVRGIKDPKMSVNFVIKTSLVNLSFQAKHQSGNTWQVTVPPLKMLEVGATHPYMITVDVEGYHFEPMTGEVQIVSEIKPRVSKVSVKKEEKKPAPKTEEKKTDVKPTEVPEEEELTQPEEKKSDEPKKEEKKVEEARKSTDLEKTAERIITRETLRKSPSDVAVRRVLDEVKKANVEPVVVVPSETPEQIEQKRLEEARLAEQAAREAAVRDILKGMSGTKATIRH